MAMTHSQMRTMLGTMIGNRTDVTDAELTQYLNLTQIRLARLHDWEELRSTTDLTLSFESTKESDKTVDLSSLTNLHKIFTVVVEDEWQSQKLIRKDLGYFEESIPLPEQYSREHPRIYTMWTRTEMLVWPVPDAAYTMRVRWYKYPADLTSDSQESDFEYKDDMILFLTASFVFAVLREEEQADTFFKMYLAEVGIGKDDEIRDTNLRIRPNFLGHENPSAAKYTDPFVFDEDAAY